MKIWIINHYASTLETGFGGRWYYLAKEFARQNHNVKIIASANHHLLKIYPQLEGSDYKIEKKDGFEFIWLKTVKYDGSHSKLRRILSERKFNQAAKMLEKIYRGKPDIIIYSMPSLIGYQGAYAYAKKNNIKIIADVRDMWPLTLIEMGVPKYHPFVIYLSFLEKHAYLSASHIISNWPYAINYFNKFGIKNSKFSWIPNGFSIDEFNQPEELDNSIIRALPPDKFIVGYAGTFGLANALESFIKCASLLKDYPKILLVIVGSGKDKDALMKLAQDMSVSNLEILDRLDKRQIPSFLKQIDACYVGLLNISLYKYGSSLTKLPEYLASKKPIIYASSSIFQPVDEYQAGLTVPAEDEYEIAKAIIELYKMSKEQREILGHNGYVAAINNYEYHNLANKVLEIIDGLN